MGLVRGDGKEELPCSAEAIYEGYLYRAPSSAYTMTIVTSHSDVVLGVAEESSKDAFGAAKTLVSGDKASFYLPNCGKIVKVAMITAQTCHRGAGVYVAADGATDGCADVAATGGAVLIGHYMGPEGLVTSGVTLVDVLLDCRVGQT